MANYTVKIDCWYHPHTPLSYGTFNTNLIFVAGFHEKLVFKDKILHYLFIVICTIDYSNLTMTVLKTVILREIFYQTSVKKKMTKEKDDFKPRSWCFSQRSYDEPYIIVSSEKLWMHFSIFLGRLAVHLFTKSGSCSILKSTEAMFLATHIKNSLSIHDFYCLPARVYGSW